MLWAQTSTAQCGCGLYFFVVDHMVDQIYIRALGEDDIAAAHALVSAVFDEFVAPLFSVEGIREFKSFIEPPRLIERLRANSFILAAEIDGEMVGVIGVRDWSHVFLLFVRGDQQGKGIAKLLLAESLQRCKTAKPDLTKVTVNSSPNAVGAYRRMGFNPTNEEQLTNGVRYVPMVLDSSERDTASASGR
jgi:GNAT superfamily N-acetyltransferase